MKWGVLYTSNGVYFVKGGYMYCTSPSCLASLGQVRVWSWTIAFVPAQNPIRLKTSAKIHLPYRYKPVSNEWMIFCLTILYPAINSREVSAAVWFREQSSDWSLIAIHKEPLEFTSRPGADLTNIRVFLTVSSGSMCYWHPGSRNDPPFGWGPFLLLHRSNVWLSGVCLILSSLLPCTNFLTLIFNHNWKH